MLSGDSIPQKIKVKTTTGNLPFFLLFFFGKHLRTGFVVSLEFPWFINTNIEPLSHELLNYLQDSWLNAMKPHPTDVMWKIKYINSIKVLGFPYINPFKDP